MKKNPSLKELHDQVKDLCVTSYLKVLGFGCYVGRGGFAGFPALCTSAGMLYVDFKTNQYRFGVGGIPRGGVLEIAALVFEVSKLQVLLNIASCRIDLLLVLRSQMVGNVYYPWHVSKSEVEQVNAGRPIPQRLASFFTKW